MQHCSHVCDTPCTLRIAFTLAFLVTFSALFGAGMIWPGLLMGLSGIDSAMLKAIAEWLSPEGISGGIFYPALCGFCFAPFARRFLCRSP